MKDITTRSLLPKNGTRASTPEQHVGIVSTVRGMDDDERRELLKKRQQLTRNLEMIEQGGNRRSGGCRECKAAASAPHGRCVRAQAPH